MAVDATSGRLSGAFRDAPAALAILRHRISFARVVIFSTIVVSSTFLRLTSMPSMPLGRVCVLAGVEIAIVAPFRAWFATGRALGVLLAATFAVDLVVLPLALVIPGFPGVFHMLYLSIIVPVALTSVAWGAVMIGIASLSHVALLVAAGADAASPDFVAPIVIFLVVGQQCVYYSRRIAESAREAATESTAAAALLHVARELADASSSTALLERVVELARDLSGGEWSSVLMRDGHRGTYRVAGLVSRTGIADEEIRAMEFAPGEFPDHLVPPSDECVLVADGDAEVPAWLRARWRMAGFFAVAMRRENEMVGLLLVGRRTDGNDALTERLLIGVARQAVLALEHARVLEDLRTAGELKTEFVGTMSHELRSPLNAILGYVEILTEEDGEPGNATREGRRALLARVRAHGVQLLEMIAATLDLSRLELGRVPVTRAPIPGAILFDEIRAGIPDYWRKAPVALEWRYGELPVVETDAAKVQTIVRNLVHNALKFTEAGRVTVAARVDRLPDGARGELSIVVSDTGVGIRADRQSVVFEMFRQGDGSDSRRYGGVGLGLYIARRLTTALGGTIALESDEGVGSTFTVSIPVGVEAVDHERARSRAAG